MAAGGRRQRSCYGTRNWSQGQGGGLRTPPRAGGRILCVPPPPCRPPSRCAALRLFPLLLPGSRGRKGREGKGEKSDAGTRGFLADGGELLSNLTTRVEGGGAGGGGRVVRGEEDGERRE